MTNRFQEQDFSNTKFKFSSWLRLAKVYLPIKKTLLSALIINTITPLSEILFPLINSYAIDYFLIKNGDLGKMPLFIGVSFFVIIVANIGFLLFFKYCAKLEMFFAYSLKQELFHKLQKMSFSYFDVTPVGWIISRVTSDVNRLAEIMSWALIDLFSGLGYLVFATTIMLIVNYKLALLVLIVVPFIYYISYWFQIRILKNYRGIRRLNSIITGRFNEGIQGAKTTKTLGIETLNLDEFKVDTLNMKYTSIKAGLFSNIYRPLINFVSSLAIALVIWQGGHQVFQGIISFGTLLLFLQYANQFFQPLRNFANIYAEAQNASANAERIFSLLDEEIAIVDTKEVIEKYGTILQPKTENYEDIKGDIEFKDIEFYYNQKEPILKDFNLKVQAGQTVALIGETGSGKSTIVNLLCRFYEPISGEVLIDGIDYRKRSIGWLHSKIGYVLQAPHLFSGTIMENIRYGNLSADDEEVYRACKLLKADEFIEKLDKGYQSDVGEGGNKLSTGQKQLISFARAIVANPSIYVLDEATSSIDSETEKIIQYTIEQVMKDKTTFIIAHRLSTIVNADVILVIQNGKIIEQGNHETLMNLKQHYYRLYTNQFNEQLQDELMKGVKHEAFE